MPQSSYSSVEYVVFFLSKALIGPGAWLSLPPVPWVDLLSFLLLCFLFQDFANVLRLKKIISVAKQSTFPKAFVEFKVPRTFPSLRQCYFFFFSPIITVSIFYPGGSFVSCGWSLYLVPEGKQGGSGEH